MAGMMARHEGHVRIAFDSRCLGRRELAERGIGRYARCLLAALREMSADVVTLADLRRPPAPGRVAELWEHLLLARDARRTGAQVLHSPTIDMATVRPRMPYVVTLHDLAPLKQPATYLRTGVKHRLRYAAVRHATRIIAPSRAVADDARELLSVEQIDVVAEAPAPIFRPIPAPSGLLPRLRLPAAFMLWVGGLDPPDPRKGLEPLVERVAAGATVLPLVLAGRYDAATARLARPGRLILTGRLSDEELAALYSAAEVLVLPSHDEGFGLTAHEALACGTPVAAYAIAALDEALGGNPAVRLVPPGDLDALVDAAQALSGTKAGIPARTWADVARETASVYELALGGAHR
jgi:glycosyltransferase involved in cell wall biosynthesis